MPFQDTENVAKTLITGVTGFLGRHLIRYLQGSSSPLYGLSRKAKDDAVSPAGCQVVRGDLLRPEELTKLRDKFDFVIHLAGEKRNPALFGSVNATGLKNLLEALSSFKQFVLVSSVGVIGPPRSTVVHEETPAHPLPGYESSKYLGEQLLTRFCGDRGYQYTILRPTSVFGEFNPGRPLLNWMKQIGSGKFFYLGKQRVYFNYVYADDVAQACWDVLGNPKALRQIFQVATPVPLPEAVDTVAQELKVAPPRRRLPRWLGYVAGASLGTTQRVLGIRVPYDLGRYRQMVEPTIYSGEKLEKDFGFRPKVGILEGLRRLAQYYRSQGYL